MDHLVDVCKETKLGGHWKYLGKQERLTLLSWPPQPGASPASSASSEPSRKTEREASLGFHYPHCKVEIFQMVR